MKLTAAKLKDGAWLELGRYAAKPHTPAPILWRRAGKTGTSAVSFIAAYVLTDQPFDDRARGYENGDNLWSKSTLRARLNNSGQGFLRGLTPAELEALETVELTTPVCSSYEAERRRSTETTRDRVWVTTWDEYKKLPKELRSGTPSPSYMQEYPDFCLPKQPHWSRTPNDGHGCFVHELFFKRQEECNSGCSEDWGIRPLIALRSDQILTGTGTETSPYRLA